MTDSLAASPAAVDIRLAGETVLAKLVVHIVTTLTEQAFFAVAGSSDGLSIFCHKIRVASSWVTIISAAVSDTALLSFFSARLSSFLSPCPAASPRCLACGVRRLAPWRSLAPRAESARPEKWFFSALLVVKDDFSCPFSCSLTFL